MIHYSVSFYKRFLVRSPSSYVNYLFSMAVYFHHLKQEHCKYGISQLSLSLSHTHVHPYTHTDGQYV